MRVTRIIITRHQLDGAWNHRQELHAKYYGLSIFHLIGWKYQERKKKTNNYYYSMHRSRNYGKSK